MKRIFLIFAVASLLMGPVKGQNHRHSPQVNDTMEISEAPTDSIATDNPDEQFDNGDENQAVDLDSGQSEQDQDLNVDDPFDLLYALTRIGPSGAIVAIFFCLMVVAICVSPWVLLGFLILKFRNKNQAKGTPIIPGKIADDEMKAEYPQGDMAPYTSMKPIPDNKQLNKGVVLFSIGIGLILMGIALGWSFFTGVGIFMCCIGGGQIFLAFFLTKKSQDNNNF